MRCRTSARFTLTLPSDVDFPVGYDLRNRHPNWPCCSEHAGWQHVDRFTVVIAQVGIAAINRCLMGLWGSWDLGGLTFLHNVA